ncbi:Na+/H+ antiporter NhaA [Legionella sp. W05-934-2]|uniref:Na+/H+ antiporter NhaA n=1 Tax=Legionella sp. W05-934-2 TaxID=1198649 RepID=UPI003462ADAE
MKKNDTFYSLETLGGILLFFSAAIAIIIANTPMRFAYNQLIATPVLFQIGDFHINKPLLLWVNDGLMSIYFLLVGLEIKREIKRGILSDKTSILVPAITALSGLLVPALIFTLFNVHDKVYLQGWAIPSATDIAFTLGILSLLGSRIPVSLKILLTAIAIFDDMAAIAIIAVFYTGSLSFLSLCFAGLFVITLIGLNYFGCKKVSVFVFFGVLLWVAVLKSGVHATLAGIVLAMTIPDQQQGNKPSMLETFEHELHPWIVFLILPAFALVNAGVSLVDIQWQMFVHPIVLGIAFGLFFGKQLGIFMPLYYFVKHRSYLQSDRISIGQTYGLALLCGVGFTMSLFIGGLAYKQTHPELMNLVKIGVLCGSTMAGILGYLVLRYTSTNRK